MQSMTNQEIQDKINELLKQGSQGIHEITDMYNNAEDYPEYDFTEIKSFVENFYREVTKDKSDYLTKLIEARKRYGELSNIQWMHKQN